MKKYIDTFRKENIIYRFITAMIIIVAVFFLLRVVKNTIVGLDFPNEILEPANVNLTNSILSGNVPYSLANIVTDGSEPPINYEYPFVNSVLAAGVSFITGGNTVAAHYLVSFLAMVGTGILGSIIIFRYSRTTVGATMGFLVLMFCHWRYGYISAAPDGLGLFITILTLYVACLPEKCKEFKDNNEDENLSRIFKKKFSVRAKLLICALLTVAAFYTKQYYAPVCLSIFLYFWLINKKEAFKYLGWCAVILVATVLLINWIWPLYWCYSVLNIYYGTFNGWNLEGMLNIFNQLKYLGAIFLGMVLVFIVALILRIGQNGKTTASAATSETNSNEVARKDAGKKSALTLFLLQIPIQLIILFVIGRNDGAYLSYFLQLLMPSVIISALILMEQMNFRKHEHLFIAAYALLAVFTIYFGWAKLPMHMYTKEDVAAWKQAYALIDEYREKGPVIHCHATAYNGMKNGDSTFCTGHDGDVNYYEYEIWEKSEFLKKMFPYAGYMYEENFKYWNTLDKEISEKKYSIIAMLNGGGNMYTTAEELERSGYELIDTMDLQLGNMSYTVGFWTAK